MGVAGTTDYALKIFTIQTVQVGSGRGGQHSSPGAASPTPEIHQTPTLCPVQKTWKARLLPHPRTRRGKVQYLGRGKSAGPGIFREIFMENVM